MMLHAPTQISLPLRGVELRLATLPLAGVRAALAEDEGEILNMIDDGRLEWAWNIGRANCDRREIRILARCVRDLQREEKSTVTLPEVIKVVLGPEKPFIWGNAWRRSWNCDSGHCLNLIADGDLVTLKNTDWRRGPGGSPCITWASAVRFLETRRLS
jgi:hypothetical protein